MRISNPIRALFGAAAVAAVVLGAQGCVADRPSRNGVFFRTSTSARTSWFNRATGAEATRAGS